MNEMVDRVAAELSGACEEGVTDFQHLARIAIAATREPTEGMYRAVRHLLGPVLSNGGITYERVKEIYHAMSDAALE